MKHHHHTHLDRGFTLIELLVVITIIAILASLAVPAGNIVVRKAREVQAKADIQSLVIAVKGYQTEYNRLPDATGATGDQQMELQDGNQLLPILMKPVGQGAANALNPRQISFFEGKPAKSGSGGLTPTGGFNDPWGEPYTVAMDNDGDGQISNPLKDERVSPNSTDREPQTLSADVVGFSKGYLYKSKRTLDNAIKSWR